MGLVLYGSRADSNLKFSFQQIDFTFQGGMGSPYSIKIDSNGNFSAAKGWPPREIHFGRLSQADKVRLDSIYRITRFDEFDAVYADITPDLGAYNLVRAVHDSVKNFYVYGQEGPTQLSTLDKYLTSFIDLSGPGRKDTLVVFKSLQKIWNVPPSPPQR